MLQPLARPQATGGGCRVPQPLAQARAAFLAVRRRSALERLGFDTDGRLREEKAAAHQETEENEENSRKKVCLLGPCVVEAFRTDPGGPPALHSDIVRALNGPETARN